MTTSYRSVARALAVAVVLVLAAGACSGSDDASAAGPMDPATAAAYTAAQSEEPLTLYSSQNPELIESTVEAFTAQYPELEVEPVRLASGALATRYAAERSAGVCTAGAVVVADADFLADGVRRNWFAPLSPGELPELARWPAEHLVLGAAARISIIPAAIATNTTLIPEATAPADPRALLDPALRGRLVLTDPRSTPGWMALMNMYRQVYGEEYLRGLAAQQPRVADSSVPATQQAAAGEGAVAFPTITSVVDPLVAAGAPLVGRVVTDGPTTGVEQFAVVSDCGNSRRTAALFTDFLLTRTGQSAVNGRVAASPRPDVEGTVPLPAGYRDPAVEAPDPATERRILDLLGLP